MAMSHLSLEDSWIPHLGSYRRQWIQCLSDGLLSSWGSILQCWAAVIIVGLPTSWTSSQGPTVYVFRVRLDLTPCLSTIVGFQA